jgi:polysaccharide biosynthesis/export protein
MKQLGIAFLVGILALALLSGCRTGPSFDERAATQARLAALTNLAPVAVTNAAQAGLLQPPAEHFTLGPGDRLEIEIIGDPTTVTTNAVGPDGNIYFNLLPGLDVWGRTLPEARALIEKELAQFMRQPPQVSVTLLGVESRRVWLLGRLNTAGIYPMTAPMTLLEALTVAGGPISPATLGSSSANAASGLGLSEDIADLRRSFVIRHGQVLPVDFYRLLKEGDMAQNIYLQPDDFVYVPSAVTREVFVLGAVLQPRSVSYRERISLVAAIATAQGTIKDAYLSHVAIVRGSLSHPKIAVVDYKAVTRGELPDVLLEPGDIVYVPFSPYRTLERYANLILNTFVSTVAINEGARAVSRNVAPVGVSIGGNSSGTPPPP